MKFSLKGLVSYIIIILLFPVFICIAFSKNDLRGKIVFDSGHDNIYVMDADGSNKRNLTPEQAIGKKQFSYFSPRWSPDGTRIAFIFVIFDKSTGKDDFNIYTMDADGGNKINLTQDEKIIVSYNLCWAPDGRQIAFNAWDGSKDQIFILDIEKQHITQLTKNPASSYYPSWSPDGTRIAFTYFTDSHEDIYTINPDGGNLTRLTRNPTINETHPAWSPDGTKIAFSYQRKDIVNNAIYIMDADGRNQVNISKVSGAIGYSPCWAPDGTHIAFRSRIGGSFNHNYDITVIDVDGKNLINLTNSPETNEYAPSWQGPFSVNPKTMLKTTWGWLKLNK